MQIGDESEVTNKAGTGRVNPSVELHTLHSVGQTEYQQMLVELKV